MRRSTASGEYAGRPRSYASAPAWNPWAADGWIDIARQGSNPGSPTSNTLAAMRTSRRQLLAAYDAQLRGPFPGPLYPGETMELDGPLVRYAGGPGRGDVLYRDLGGLDGAALDALIARQVAVFAARGDAFEWKSYGHDQPADLAARLVAAGFAAEDTETVMIGLVSDIAGEPQLPDGARLREVTVTAVRMTPDLRTARVFYRTLAVEARPEAAQRALERATPFLRSAVSRALGLRVVPELRFEYDTTPDTARRLDALLGGGDEDT